jgi:group II intron reverse transcriptase/maturase
MAVKIVIEPLYEADFLDCSYGFRPRRSAHQAIGKIDECFRRGFRWVVDVDLKSYFDTIPHDRLLEQVQRRVHDRSIVRLIRRWLKAGILVDGRVNYPDRGSPQGGVLSPLLSNLYLHEVDREFHRRGAKVHLVRYADDLLILCGTQKDAQKAYERLAEVLNDLGLTLNAEKTRMVHAETGFDFLGFSFRPGTYPRNGRKRTTMIKIPRRRALEGIRQRIKDAVKSVPLNEAVGTAVKTVNARLKGWTNYFRIGHLYPFLKGLIWHAEKQLRIFLRRKFQRKYSQGTRHTYPPEYLHEHLGLYTATQLYAGS